MAPRQFFCGNGLAKCLNGPHEELRSHGYLPRGCALWQRFPHKSLEPQHNLLDLRLVLGLAGKVDFRLMERGAELGYLTGFHQKEHSGDAPYLLACAQSRRIENALNLDPGSLDLRAMDGVNDRLLVRKVLIERSNAHPGNLRDAPCREFARAVAP